MADVTVTGDQLRAARVLLDCTQRQVALALKVSVDTLQRAERDRPGSVRTKAQLFGLFIRNGIRFAANGSVRRVDAAGREYRDWLQRWG
jgi:transcriptional regulator with XRE-family HTH domain